MRAIRNKTYLNIGKQTDAQKEVQAAWVELRNSEARTNAIFRGIFRGIMYAAALCLLHAAANGAILLWNLYGV